MSSKPVLRRPVLGELRSARPVSAGFQSRTCHGRLSIPGICQDEPFTSRNLADEGDIGRGGFGFVSRMRHIPTGTVMAVKRIRSTLNESEQTRTLKDLDVVMKSSGCPHIVRFYGALFEEGDCWICMESMDSSLDKLYLFVYRFLFERIPEGVLAKIAVATISALHYLKTELNVIHRDVKPSNILIDRKGNIKLCDFGISGQLVDSIAKTYDVGCRPYMAPERIRPKSNTDGYDIRSDVWSFGITMIELAVGQFPYPPWNSVFDQLNCVLNEQPPQLPEHITYQVCDNSIAIPDPPTVTKVVESNFSADFQDFVSQCLKKDFHDRPKYGALMTHPFYKRGTTEVLDVGNYFCSVLDQVPDSVNLKDL